MKILTRNEYEILSQVSSKFVKEIFGSFKDTGRGTGLGLSLAYDMIVKGYGGKLEVESEAGEFTEFIIVLKTNNI